MCTALATVGLALLAVVGGCEAPAPVIRSLSFTSIAANTSRTLRLSTEGCNPVFDIDRGALGDDATAQVTLGEGARVLDAQRTAVEEFQLVVPADLPVGSYAVALALRDGRRAPFAGRLDVLAGAQPTIEAVTSPRYSVAPGERSVPLRVTVANPTRCSIVGLMVAPRFTRNGADAAGLFARVAEAALTVPPGDHVVVDFVVDVASTASDGLVVLDATARGGRRSGDMDCAGTVDAARAESTGQWLVAAAARRRLEISEIEVNPREPHPGQLFHADLTVRNRSGVPVTMTDLLVVSSPSGVVRRLPPMFPMPELAPDASRSYRLELTSSDEATADIPYTLTLEATARSAAGDVYTSNGGVRTVVTLTSRH